MRRIGRRMAFLVGLHVPQHGLLEGAQLVGLRRAFGLAVGLKSAPDGVRLEFPQRHRAAYPLAAAYGLAAALGGAPVLGGGLVRAGVRGG